MILAKGTWVKLICGASNQDLPSISDTCAVYAAAGVHCVDIAADLAVVNAAREGLDWVQARTGRRPWLMVSVSDGKDSHFRKAFFNPKTCPQNCPRPCQKICPANAITDQDGIIPQLCYGCGRCLPACPFGYIKSEEHFLSLKDFHSFFSTVKPDAIEIHTAPGRAKAFQTTIEAILKSQITLNRIAVSCGLEGHKTNSKILAQELWQRYQCLRKFNLKPIWQLDGRPMSGDIGPGTARVALSLWKRLRPIAPPGPLQIAGGTNGQTIQFLDSSIKPEGIAFGGVARKLIQPLIMEAQAKNKKLTEWPDGWNKAVEIAKSLINPWLLN